MPIVTRGQLLVVVRYYGYSSVLRHDDVEPVQSSCVYYYEENVRVCVKWCRIMHLTLYVGMPTMT